MAVDSLGQLTVDLVANTGGFEKGMDRAQRALKSATKEAAYQAGQLDKLVGQIDPVIGAYGRLDKMEEQLRKHRAAGRLDNADFTMYLNKLKEQRDSVEKVDRVMAKNGQTAKQYAANLRGVPAQFTDIAVSLQAGQAPLTVLLQQGGQLKDMFGGIGAASKALGGYLMSLVSPITVAASAAGALALVYYDAEKEVSAFNKALFSGSASSGQTSASLSKISKDTATITGNLSQAKDAVVALAASSGLSQVQFKNLAEASASISEFTGKGAGEVAKSLGDMGDNATKAAEKISAQYGLLTSAQYEVIVALDNQGKKQEALDSLSESLNQNAQERLKKYRDSLSEVERDWNDIGTAISNAYSNVKSSLFPDLNQEIANLEKVLEGRKSGGFLSSFFSDELGPDSQSTKFIEAQLKSLKQQRDVAASKAEIDAAATRQNQDRIAAESKWNALSKKELGDQAKLAKDIADARKLGVEAGRSQAEIDKVVADIQAKFDKSQPKTKAYTENAGMKALDQAKQQYAVLLQQNSLIGAQGDGVQKLGAAQQVLIKWEQELADIKGKKTLTAEQQSLLANQELITAQLKRNAALETENTLREKGLETRRKLAAFDENLKSQLSSAQQGLDNNLAGIGLGDEQRKRLQEQRNIRQSYQSQMDKLTSDYNKSNKDQFSTELYDKETQSLKSALDQRLAMQTKYYEDEDAARSDWQLGASSAFDNYLNQARDVAGQARSAFTSLYDGLTDAAVDWAFGADKTFGDVATSFAKMVAKMAFQSAASNVFTSIAGSAAGAAISGAFGGGAAPASMGSTAAGYTAQYGFDDGGYTGPGGKYEPAGIVHGGEVVIRKEVVDQPGMKDYLVRLNKRGYADGGYVGLSGGASAAPAATGQVVINQSFQVESAGGGASQQDSQALGQAYADVARRGAQQEIAKETQPGGQIWRLVNGR